MFLVASRRMQVQSIQTFAKRTISCVQRITELHLPCAACKVHIGATVCSVMWRGCMCKSFFLDCVMGIENPTSCTRVAWEQWAEEFC